jgi:hypothetical protein
MSDDKKILKEVIADKEKGDVQSRDKAMEGITQHRPDSLKHAETVVKNNLPTAADIESEKKKEGEKK